MCSVHTVLSALRSVHHERLVASRYRLLAAGDAAVVLQRLGREPRLDRVRTGLVLCESVQKMASTLD